MNNNNHVLHIVLDTNFLLIPFQFKLNFKTKFDELLDIKYEIVLLKEVYDELLHIVKKARGKQKQGIQAAIQYFGEKEKILILEKRENEMVDDLLLRIATDNKYIIATNDKGLKRRLKNQGSNFIYLRQKSYFKSHRSFG